MAATRGQRFEDRCRDHEMWQQLRCRPEREAGVKGRRSMAELASSEPID